MGTMIFTTDKPRKDVIANEFRPYEVVAFSFDDVAAAVAVRIPLNDENVNNFRHVYALSDTDKSVIVAVVVKHEGSLNGTGRRNVSWKEISEEMRPYYTGGASKSFLEKLTPLLPLPEGKTDGENPLFWAHEWREEARMSK